MKDSSYVDDSNLDEIKRIDDIKQSIIFSGELHMRNLFSDKMDTKTILMFQDSYWSKRYAVIKAGEIHSDIHDHIKWNMKNY